MTAAEIITVIAAVGGLVTVIGGVIVNIVSAMRKESKEALASIDKKTDAITVKVDGAASKSVDKIEALQTEMAQLRTMLADSKQTAAVLAQAHASAVPVPPSAAVVESLGKIESHTEQTAKNTEPAKGPSR